MNQTNAICLSHLNFAYSKEPIIKDFSLEIKAGSFLCITGKSGCGKSTLLRLMNGLLVPQSGEVRINGKKLTPENQVEVRRGIGYILQEGSLFPHFTVYQNMTCCLDLLHYSEQDKRARLEVLQPLVQLSPRLLHKYPHELSGGQRQRVGIVRGIIHAPDIVMMDEPFSALDPETRSNLQDLVKRIHEETKTTFVMITHALSEAEKLGTQIIQM